MLSESIVAAAPPPASWRNFRRLTARISITYLASTGNARNVALVQSSRSLTAAGRRWHLFFNHRGRANGESPESRARAELPTAATTVNGCRQTVLLDGYQP
jgi:hypothetical protein